mgnify:CR=1 FL=1
MDSHPLDVVVLLPGFYAALTHVFEMLVEQGLEVYLQDDQWFWRWRPYGIAGQHGYASMGEAVAAALVLRLRQPYPVSGLPMN